MLSSAPREEQLCSVGNTSFIVAQDSGLDAVQSPQLPPAGRVYQGSDENALCITVYHCF